MFKENKEGTGGGHPSPEKSLEVAENTERDKTSEKHEVVHEGVVGKVIEAVRLASPNAIIFLNGLAPHLLSMTATPIPRTLALTLYGDLNLSLIRSKPGSRQKIITKVVAGHNRDKAYDWILKRLQNGEQMFVICPLVEASLKLQVKSVLDEYKKLSEEVYPQLKVNYVHGQMKSADKDKVVSDFRAGHFPILVASSVVEVGIDIPGATMMLIEGAERFGLAQLHQLRGRIGRNDKPAFCFLFTSSAEQQGQQRLQALTKYDDGFQLAEIDLQLRGAGEVFGTRQSGLVELKAAQLTDSLTIQKARHWAERLLTEKIFKQDKLLQARLRQEISSLHLE